jgi:hypothetical protein
LDLTVTLQAGEEDRCKKTERVLQQAVADAERGIAAGEWVDHGEIAAKLKHWAGAALVKIDDPPRRG